MEIALIISIAVNVLLLLALFIQRAKSIAVAQATTDLVSRIVKLEEAVRHPPEKVSIVQEKKQKELP